jgi:Protein of unknown function DUF262/Protein of unknown function (DUF1524)
MPGLREPQLEGIGHALADRVLGVPDYQRSYAWEERHVRDLLQDLAAALQQGEPEYFLGSIVTTKSATGEIQVVDGQQRLATTTILIAAIRDYFYGTGDRDRASQLETKFLVSPDLRTQERRPRLRLNLTDHDFFQKVVLSLPDVSERAAQPSRESHRRLAAAAGLAKGHVASLVNTTNQPSELLITWVEYLDAKARVIWFEVPDDANAFTIFETLNDRGLELAISDLLKNYLFQRAGDRLREVQQNWTEMMAVLEAAQDERTVVTYLRHLWSSRHGHTREKDLYKAIKTGVTSKQGAVDFSADLTLNARTYAAILNTNHELWNMYGVTARAHMGTIALLGMVQIRPLLLAVFSKFTPTDVTKSLGLMVSWGVRFLIGGAVGSGTLEKYYSDQAKRVNDGQLRSSADLAGSMRSVVPTDVQFEQAFLDATVSKAALARFYLRALEESERGGSPPFIPNPAEEIVNLEHVLPEKPSPNWEVSDEMLRTYRRRLGNLALLGSQENNDLADLPFPEKRAVYAISEFRLTKMIADNTIWRAEEIEQRQRYLAGLAVRAWPAT